MAVRVAAAIRLLLPHAPRPPFAPAWSRARRAAFLAFIAEAGVLRHIPRTPPPTGSRSRPALSVGRRALPHIPRPLVPVSPRSRCFGVARSLPHVAGPPIRSGPPCALGIRLAASIRPLPHVPRPPPAAAAALAAAAGSRHLAAPAVVAISTFAPPPPAAAPSAFVFTARPPATALAHAPLTGAAAGASAGRALPPRPGAFLA